MFHGQKDLIGIKQLSRQQIEEILDVAKTMKFIINQPTKRTVYLQGKSIVTLFCENSTRTKLSFESAVKYMGGMAGSLATSTSSTQKGESLLDTVKTINQMGTNCVIIRHSMSGTPEFIGKNVDACIINAGDGMNEHPTQALLDMFTIMEKKGKIEGLDVAIVGDIYHSRVARSDIYALTKLGAKVKVAAPPTLLPPYIEKLGVEICDSVDEAIKDVDVVMALRIQNERQKSGLFPSTDEYSKFFGLNHERIKLAKPDAILMHPGPVNRGVELTPELADGEQSVILEQVTNGVAVRMAVLNCFLGGTYEHTN